MNSEIQKIELVKPIRPEIKRIEEPSPHYEVLFKLESEPDQEWISSFTEWYSRVAYEKRVSSISKDLIIVQISDQPQERIIQEIRQQSGYIKETIEKANAEYEKACQEEIEKKEHEKLMHKEQENQLRKLQDELDKINFGC